MTNPKTKLRQFRAEPRTTINKTTKKQKLLIGGFIALCMLLVVAISQVFLIQNSVRLDEAQSLWQTSHSVRGTLKVVAQDVHVPLYHMILHFWQFYLGQDIVTARLLSLGFFLATIPFVYLLARRVLSVKWALVALAFFSLSPFMNWYANETRMYTLLAFFATLSQYYFLRIMDNKPGKGGWLGYTLTALIGVYTHYFFAFNLLSQAIFFLLARKHFPAGSLKKFIGVAIATAAVMAPWIKYFVDQGSASNTSPNLIRPSSVDFSNVFSNFAFGFQTDTINTVLISTWPLLVIVALLAVKQNQKATPKFVYMLTAAMLPVALAFALSYVVSPFFLSRYMVSCVAPLIIVITWFVSNYGKRLATAITAVLAIVMVIASIQQYSSAATPVKENYREAANYITDRADPQDIVVLSAPFTVYPFDYYYTGKARVETLPVWNRNQPGAIPAFNPSTLGQQVDQLNDNHTYVYLLLSYDQGYQEQIYQYYEQRFTRVQQQRFSDDLLLSVYQVGYDTVTPVSQTGTIR